METMDLADLAEVPVQSETQELTVVPDNFLTKPFDDYTTTEGLLLLIALFLVLSLLDKFFGRCTSWLLS